MSVNFTVRAVSRSAAWPFVVGIHYAHRWPVHAEHIFGLFQDGEIVGAVTFGPPSSPQVAASVNPSLSGMVVELSRLALKTEAKNAASALVGRALKLLPVPMIVVSYADEGKGHVGYVYQATNFYYGGRSVPHDSEYLIGGKRVHPRTLASRGITSPRAWARVNGIEAVQREAKHRYVYIVAKNSKQRENILASVLWPLSRDYPKGTSERYEYAKDVPQQVEFF